MANKITGKLQIIYACKECDYACSVKGNYTKHLATRKHKIRHRGVTNTPEKSPEKLQIFRCDTCDYISSRSSEYARHITTRKHLNLEMALKKSPENYKLFYCEKCASTCSSKRAYAKHLTTPKHNGANGATKSAKKITRKLQIESTTPKQYPCLVCDNTYARAYNLARHVRAVHPSPDAKETSVDMARLCARNDELYQTIVGISKQLQQSSAPIAITNNHNHSHTVHNTNSHNKTFNLNFFLNETCKNAMNISEFIETIQVSLGELERVGEIGFVKGISDIITSKLNGLALTERPIHCSDLKRETMYVKDKDEWAKDAAGNPKMKHLIQHVSHKNLGTLGEWRETHPDYGNPTRRDSDRYQSLVASACDASGRGADSSGNAIIKRVARRVVLEKNAAAADV